MKLFTIKAALNFVLYAIALAAGGMALVIIVAQTNAGQLSGWSAAAVVIGAFAFFFSPIISAFIVYKQFDRVREKEANAVRLADEQNAIRLSSQLRFFEREKLIAAIEMHHPALERNLHRAVRQNDYGMITEDNRNAALREFFDSIDLQTDRLEFEEAANITYEHLETCRARFLVNGFEPDLLPADGLDFEIWVANSLVLFGWEAQTTPAGGDQGLDVIAKRDGRSLGLQCKLYGSAVGNKAVQEAYAGRPFHGVQKVGVISNAGFTSSAKALAHSTGVHLFSPNDIPTMFEQTFGS
ncbi:restriction endonuclease [Alteriqipengyuania flavescens]|uniref:restriction endonuclease n=1 Tax=Alteriqipengyuania flavescens TaxID=3053610 RepID=UPI0025B4B60B|nr:restriction endonuclease [Alteriqipengyuania flavescens]WJY19707.1 restriction endonuclease [Alteriqipengyuania flavescens]WJY25647.1 restriction endonuclease [Alteriqipengyuania flavescens]